MSIQTEDIHDVRSFDSIWSSRFSRDNEKDTSNPCSQGGVDMAPAAMLDADPTGIEGIENQVATHADRLLKHESTGCISNLLRCIQNDPTLIGVLATLATSMLIGLVIVRGVLSAPGILNSAQTTPSSLSSTGEALLSTASPSDTPSVHPSAMPSPNPSTMPSRQPSCDATATVSAVTKTISIQSAEPSRNPSSSPSAAPSAEPSSQPSGIPSTQPSATPSYAPSNNPTSSPSTHPSTTPSHAPSSFPSSSPTDTPLIFYVMGDAPYSDEEAEELKDQVADIPNDAEFVVHVGDINRPQETNCTRDVYTGVSSILARSRTPVFILPGDNDIIDCPNPFLARFYWTQSFQYFENRWKHSLNVERQTRRFENFAFFHHRVLFIGVDVVGSSAYSEKERSARLDNDLLWVQGKLKRYWDEMAGLIIFGHSNLSSLEKPFFKPLAKTVKKLKVPTLYIHGNGHKWEYKKKAFGVRNMIRVQVDRGGRAPPLRVKFRGDAEDPFEFDRRR